MPYDQKERASDLQFQRFLKAVSDRDRSYLSALFRSAFTKLVTRERRSVRNDVQDDGPERLAQDDERREAGPRSRVD
jgi:hypothetical protein